MTAGEQSSATPVISETDNASLEGEREGPMTIDRADEEEPQDAIDDPTTSDSQSDVVHDPGRPAKHPFA